MTTRAMASTSGELDTGTKRGDYVGFLRKVQKDDPTRLTDREMSSAFFVNLYQPPKLPLSFSSDPQLGVLAATRLRPA